eukprot:TRINITY_DN8405_c0_g1_i1.p1 TRINITY_DN8405_c0_g1~~TRINITY_DN8405_c0_g1_i1.p1  ORF type:complete len:408 (-),score=62.46 TRINITY_DN8405_c0_g1_i1:114-1337(-)
MARNIGGAGAAMSDDGSSSKLLGGCGDVESASSEEDPIDKPPRKLSVPEGTQLSRADLCCLRSAKVWVITVVFVLLFAQVFIVLMVPSQNKGGFNNWRTKEALNEKHPTDNAGERLGAAAIATLLGIKRQEQLQASILVCVSFLLIFAGTLTATFISTLDQKSLPEDFRQKGTISNVTQNVLRPEGRLWTTSLGFGSVLLIISMYTFWIYRSWEPWVNLKDNPMVEPAFQSSLERGLRCAWVIVPYVGFIVTAMAPSLSLDKESGNKYDIVLTAVHNVCAPLSMLFCMVMETVQLIFGEHVFRYFFTHEPSPLYGPLTPFQRWRAITLVEAWIAGIVFVSVQGYLAFVPNNRYWIALVSYYGEVIGLLLAFLLPAISGMEILSFGETYSVVTEGAAVSYLIATKLPA